jgi:hypothetical protein
MEPRTAAQSTAMVEEPECIIISMVKDPVGPMIDRWL